MTAEKVPAKKEVPKKIGLKKPLIIGGIAVIVAIAGIVGGIMILGDIDEKGGTLMVGIDKYRLSVYEDFDPLIAIFTARDIIISQVVETLFDDDYSTGRSRIISTLAEDYAWNDDATELTCFLRQNVKFHDSTAFNAMAVKWNFERIYRMIDIMDDWGHMFLLPDGRWIVNETQVIDEYTVKFVLNSPFVPFLQILTQTTASILSPTSTPADDILDIHTEDLVGTGPFIYESYNTDVNITMNPYPNYWGKKPKIDKLIFSLYDSGDDQLNALLTKKISILDPNFYIYYPKISIETLRNDPEITVREKLSVNYFYIIINNKLINLTMRKAISYAINYTYMVEEVIPNWPVVRARSPVPEGILYSNTTAFDVPYYNISTARKILKDAGWPGTENLTINDDISPGNEWELLVNNETPLEAYTIDYFPSDELFARMIVPIPDNLKQIGVKAIPRAWSWSDPHHLTLAGWIYDFNDPHNGLFAGYSSSSPWAASVLSINVNDSLIDQWIDDGVRETDTNLREQIYFNIQKRLIEELYPVVWAFSSKNIDVYASNLGGWQPNPFKILLKTVYFV